MSQTRAGLLANQDAIGKILSASANIPPLVQDINGVNIGQFCRAWLYGHDNGSALTVLSSFNIATGSITRNATCDWVFPFTVAMPSATYCVVGCSGENTTSQRTFVLPWNSTNPTASSFRAQVTASDGVLAGSSYVLFAVISP